MEKKTILIVKEDITAVGGSERVAYAFMNELSEDYIVKCVSIKRSNTKLPYFLKDNISISYLSQGSIRIRYHYPLLLMKYAFYLLRNKVDVVMNIGVGGIFVSWLTRLVSPRTKVISCEHSNLKNKTDNDSKRLSQKWSAYFSHKIITLTEKDRGNYIEEFSLPQNKVDYIYNFIDNNLVIQPEEVYQENSKKIITVGRLTEVKGYDRLIKIASKALENSDWEWHIYGDGEERVKIEKWIREQGLEKKVILKGNVSNIYELYSDYSFFVMTSYFEGLPMVLLEAQANRLPVISFDCETGPSEIIEDGVNGILVENGNLEEMVEKIKMLMQNQELRSEYSRNSTKNLDKFSKEEIIEQWKLLIEGMK